MLNVLSVPIIQDGNEAKFLYFNSLMRQGLNIPSIVKPVNTQEMCNGLRNLFLESDYNNYLAVNSFNVKDVLDYQKINFTLFLGGVNINLYRPIYGFILGTPLYTNIADLGITVKLRLLTTMDGNVYDFKLQNYDVSPEDFGLIPSVSYINKEDLEFKQIAFKYKTKIRNLVTFQFSPNTYFIPFFFNFAVFDNELFKNLHRLYYGVYIYGFQSETLTTGSGNRFIYIRQYRNVPFDFTYYDTLEDSMCLKEQYKDFDIIQARKIDTDLIMLVYYSGGVDEFKSKLNNGEIKIVLYDSVNNIEAVIDPATIKLGYFDEDKVNVKFEVQSIIDSNGMSLNDTTVNIM